MTALALVAVLESGIRLYAPRTPWRSGPPSFDLLVDQYRYKLAALRPAVWLLGNSTLHKDLDIDQLRATTGSSIQSLPVGSGTLAGETAMLDYFLRRAPVPPTTVVFCLTKDDLNRHGYRAKHSANYLAYDSWRGWTVDRLFRLDDVRATWLEKLKASLSSPPPPAQETAPEGIRRFDGRMDPHTFHHLKSLSRNFTFDDDVFPQLAALSRKYGFRIAICLMPVTDFYLQFHDKRYLQQSSADIAARLSDHCVRHGIDFYDYTRVALARHEWFEDTYHMNSDGRAWFTPLLAHDLGAQLRQSASGTSSGRRGAPDLGGRGSSSNQSGGP